MTLADPNHMHGGLAPGQQLGEGRYTLVRFLGQGGMGVVWLARDERLHEDVALKFLAPAISHDATALEDMRRETLKSRRLTHPNIIRIHDLFESANELPFISMEYIEGTSVSLLKAQQEQRLFSWEYLKPLVKQLCDALEYAHGEKVIHRDLKPGNIMLDARGRLKLADFGIAASASESLSRISANMGSSGTPAYMSPQQMNGRAPRATDDIYALGATIYELLTSKPPFYSGDISYQVRDLPPDPLEQRLAELGLTNEIPPDVAAMVMACLAKEPEQRPQSAAAVAEWIGLTIGVRSQGASLLASASPANNVTPEERASERSESNEPFASPARTNVAVWLAVSVAALALVGAGVWWMKQPKSGNSSATTKVENNGEPSVNSSAPQALGTSPNEGYVTLFNGRDLSGWKVPKPNLWWSVKNGVLTGKQDPKAKGNVLETVRTFKDVVVECDARWSSNGDSGIFVREGQKIQCQIGFSSLDQSDTTGSIYISRLGYAPGKINFNQLIKAGDWNHLKFEARGPRFRVWLNDTLTTEYSNPSLGNAGPIGLQILAKPQNMWVEFRNLRVKPLTNGDSQ